MALVDQLGGTVGNTGRTATAAELERQAKLAVAEIAVRVGKTTSWVAESLEALTDALRDVGLRSQGDHPRIRRILGLLDTVQAEIGAWCAKADQGAVAAYGDMIRSVATLTITLTRRLLEEVDRMTDNTVALLETWSADSRRIVDAASRPEWMLDGWEPICCLWRQAIQPLAQRAALVEMGLLVPVLPREAVEWTGMAEDTDMAMRFRRLVPLNEDWRTGAQVFELIARNEALRAAEL